MSKTTPGFPAFDHDAPVTLEQVTKTYGKAAGEITALNDVSLSLPRGSFTAVMGPSGSGKSTLLHCAAGLDVPTTGRVALVGQDLTGKSEDTLTRLRRDRIAFIFQSFNLIPTLTAAQNVQLPGILAGRRIGRNETEHALERVGLVDRGTHRPGELSGGQQQRVAIARALAAQAEVLFADEPTGALDLHTAASILGLMRQAAVQSRQTIMMTTHNPAAASYADSVLFLLDGQLVDQLVKPTTHDVATRLSRLGSEDAVG